MTTQAETSTKNKANQNQKNKIIKKKKTKKKKTQKCRFTLDMMSSREAKIIFFPVHKKDPYCFPLYGYF